MESGRTRYPPIGKVISRSSSARTRGYQIPRPCESKGRSQAGMFVKVYLKGARG